MNQSKYPSRIFIAGFMGTGKSSVGKALAEKLKYQFIDLDLTIEKISKNKIDKIFEKEGEKGFRRWEKQALEQVSTEEKVVIALGGGAVCSAQNLKRIQNSGLAILLSSSVEEILKRVQKQKVKRPLLEVTDPAKRIEQLLKKRQKFYQKIAFQVSTDHMTIAQVVQKIYSQLPLENNPLQVKLQQNAYPIYFSPKGFGGLADLLGRYFPGQKLILLSNSKLDKLYGREIFRNLSRDFEVKKVLIPDGEQYKNLQTVEKIYHQLIKHQVDRKTVIIALGGGVIGDIAGFVAATYLRGIPFVQIPTTLLAQVDSSVGGKTGVDLAEGKNLIGAFYQPRFVFINPEVLKTLSKRQLICGMSEVIKYAAIFDEAFFEYLEKSMQQLLRHPGKSYEDLIRRCCAWKAWVVCEDEKEVSGLRALLNFGHTLGHAIESMTRYRKYTHGEAIAMGMVFAAERSVKEQSLDPEAVERLKKLLRQAELPIAWPDFTRKQYEKALMQDKKRVSQDIQFVYLNKIGFAQIKKTPVKDLLN
ncbi:MAG: 3-dehydroquinate synthase [Deltaproteobacteria bacterium]|nr:3-dehydroquinate synthase [Deltaproteobacteria bacterium]